jgi:tagatose-6-phosphate ketose/aldose isomerase
MLKLKMMKLRVLGLLIFMLIVFACPAQKFHLIKTDNPAFVANTVFAGYENLNDPKVKALKEKYQLDTIFHGETDEFKRILLLRNWIRKTIPINDPGPHPGDGSCESILDHALKGSGYHCGHFMVVQNAIMNAYGYVTRCLGAGPGGADSVENHHGIDEIWLNGYHKWFLSDAKYNSHFEKNGIPLSALEIRDEYLKNKAADIVRVKGPERTVVGFDEEYKISKEHFARTYANIEWDTYNDKYTPDKNIEGDRGILTMYNDDYFKHHTWLWDGKPHWAYNTKFMRLVSDRHAIEWTPNTIESTVSIEKDKALVILHSVTPNFQTYQVRKISDEDWKNVSSRVELELKDKTQEYLFRTVNLAGVSGPLYKIIIAANEPAKETTKRKYTLIMESAKSLEATEVYHMYREMHSQPDLWRDTYVSLLNKGDEIKSFLDKIYKIKNLQIILSGAGTSAYIGEILQQSFYRNTGILTKAIPTTDLVTHPGDYFKKNTPTLLVSFARSGDSPESIATFELAEKLHDQVYHLIITCNPDGKLVKVAEKTSNSCIFLLPDGTNDQALAMTSSFSCMTLAALLISDIRNIQKNAANVEKLIEYGKAILNNYGKSLKQAAGLDFKRVIFLGSGALKGTAKESQLKVIELTDGQIIGQYDSFLGFRHGPRAAVQDSTLLIYLFSSDPYVHNYEIDLVKSINQTEKFIFSIGIGQCISELEGMENLTIDLCSANKIPDDYFSVCSVIPAQMLGFFKSIALGLVPDSPSQNGGIHRIVQGVTIYPY